VILDRQSRKRERRSCIWIFATTIQRPSLTLPALTIQYCQETRIVESFAGVRAGDDHAAAEVVRRYTDRLIRLAHTELETWLRRRADPEDILQSVYRTFFHRIEDGQFTLQNWDELWRLLGLITLRKCKLVRKFHLAEKRSPFRESPALEDASHFWQRFTDDAPTPDEAAYLIETLERLMREVSDEHRQIAERTFRGQSAADISRELGCPERRLRERWKRQLETWFQEHE